MSYGPLASYMPIVADTKSLRSIQNVATLLSLDKIKTPPTGLVLLILSEVFIVILCCLNLIISGSDFAVLAHDTSVLWKALTTMGAECLVMSDVISLQSQPRTVNLGVSAAFQSCHLE